MGSCHNPKPPATAGGTDKKRRRRRLINYRIGLISDANWSDRPACLARWATGAAVGAVFTVAAVFRLFPKTAKNHLACCRLQNAGHGDVSVTTDQASRIINYDHGAI